MRIILWTCFLALLTMTAPARAAEPQGGEQKNLCLLDSEQCPDRKPTIQELIDQLKGEIAKGDRVYTKDELRRLQQKLQEAESQYWWIQYGR